MSWSGDVFRAAGRRGDSANRLVIRTPYFDIAVDVAAPQRKNSDMRVLSCAAGFLVLATALFLFTIDESPMRADGPHAKALVAHRGASAYAPEHTLAAYRLAIAQGADYVEQDLALTRDGVLICLHDPWLERTTNVEEVFPDRFTEDRSSGTPVKHWAANDFTLAEIQRLDAGSWFDPKFKDARIPTWQEAIALIRGKAGLYPELKAPSLYRARGVSMEREVIASLRTNGLDRPEKSGVPIVLQSFDDGSLKELASQLPDVPRTLLLEPDAAARWLTSPERVREIATFATGIGPAKRVLAERPAIVRWAHEAGLTVTPYTFKSSDRGRFGDVREEMAHFLYTLDVDALFTDNPDQFPRSEKGAGDVKP